MIFWLATLIATVASSVSMLYETDNKPIITAPEQNDRVYSEDNLAVQYYGGESDVYYIALTEGKNIIKLERTQSADVLRNSGVNTYSIGTGGLCIFDESLLEPEKNYELRIGRGLSFSEPIKISTFTGGEEVIKQILDRNKSNPDINAALDKIAPKSAFASSEKAAQMMETINVRVWKTDRDGKKYSSTAALTVNKNLRNNYINIFNELYALSFPINSVGCYNYRNTHGGRLSEHALGTAVDINPNQNYCLYSDGTRVGELWEPYTNPYSVTPEVVAVFKKYGFSWGGNWTGTVDYMHFSYFDS